MATVNVELTCRLLKDHAPPHEAIVSQELDGGRKLEWTTFKWNDTDN